MTSEVESTEKLLGETVVIASNNAYAIERAEALNYLFQQLTQDWMYWNINNRNYVV